MKTKSMGLGVPVKNKLQKGKRVRSEEGSLIDGKFVQTKPKDYFFNSSLEDYKKVR